jgi:hypothetical protein
MFQFFFVGVPQRKGSAERELGLLEEPRRAVILESTWFPLGVVMASKSSIQTLWSAKPNIRQATKRHHTSCYSV